MFYERYLELCIRDGKSPSGAAKEMGFPAATVTRWKNGSEPQYLTVSKVAEYFGVDISYFSETKKDPADMEISEVEQESMELLEELRDNSDMRMLLHSAKNATPEQIRAVAEMLMKFKGES